MATETARISDSASTLFSPKPLKMNLLIILDTIKGCLVSYANSTYLWLLEHLTLAALKVASADLLHYACANKIWIVIITITIISHVYTYVYRLNMVRFYVTLPIYVILWVAILSFNIFLFFEKLMQFVLGGMVNASGELIVWCTNVLREDWETQLPRFSLWLFAICRKIRNSIWGTAQGNVIEVFLGSARNVVLLKGSSIMSGTFFVVHGITVLPYRMTVAGTFFVVHGIKILPYRMSVGVYLVSSSVCKAVCKLVEVSTRGVLGKFATTGSKSTQNSEKVESSEINVDTAKAELADIIDEIVEEKNDKPSDAETKEIVTKPDSDTNSDDSSLFNRLLKRAERGVVDIQRTMMQSERNDDIEV